MKCPRCEKENQLNVTDTRQDEWTVRRRRKCNACGFILTTVEINGYIPVEILAQTKQTLERSVSRAAKRRQKGN